MAWKRLFFFNETATTEIYTLSLHDALPILARVEGEVVREHPEVNRRVFVAGEAYEANLAVALRLLQRLDRKSTRLNSSHANISYAVFCLKKKNPMCYDPFSFSFLRILVRPP